MAWATVAAMEIDGNQQIRKTFEERGTVENKGNIDK